MTLGKTRQLNYTFNHEAYIKEKIDEYQEFVEDAHSNWINTCRSMHDLQKAFEQVPCAASRCKSKPYFKGTSFRAPESIVCHEYLIKQVVLYHGVVAKFEVVINFTINRIVNYLQ